MLLTKTKLQTIKVLISKALVDLYIKHDKFVSVRNVLREYNELKEEIKNPRNAIEYTILKRWNHIVSVVIKILRAKFLVLEKLNKID